MNAIVSQQMIRFKTMTYVVDLFHSLMRTLFDQNRLRISELKETC